jgi:hypothetical protein
VLNLGCLAQYYYYEKKVPPHWSHLVKHQAGTSLSALRTAGHLQYQQAVTEIIYYISVINVLAAEYI